MDHLSISNVAKQAGVNLETIRYYERRGLLPMPPRTRAGYRVFSTSAVRRIRFIKRAQDLGFSLKEITELLALRVAAGSTCADVLQRAQAKITDIEKKIRSLREIKRSLSRLAGNCAGRGPVDACPILDALDPEDRP